MSGAIENSIDNLGHRIDKFADAYSDELQRKKRKRDKQEDSAPVVYIVMSFIVNNYQREATLETYVSGPQHGAFYKSFQDSNMYDEFQDASDMTRASLILTWLLASGGKVVGQTQDNEGFITWTVVVNEN